LSVARNVGFGLELQGWPSSDREARVEKLLALVKLAAFGGRAPHELSGGQRQRVALARALAPNPPLLLLDEPLGALDAKLRREMQIELRTLQRTTGKTFVFVTHDQEEALTMSDTIVVMNNAVIEQIGSPSDLYNDPRTEFVARFVGEMNFLECEVVGSLADGCILSWNGHRIGARTRASTPSPTRRTLAAVRPEDMSLSVVEPEGDVNKLRGTVRSRIFRGSEVRFVLDVEGTEIVAAARQHNAPEGSEQLWLGWKASRTLMLAEQPCPESVRLGSPN
jgi:spermidine/putrescine transport system ATP-binding protein